MKELAQACLKQIGNPVKPSWKIAGANIADHPDVTKFLRGPETNMVKKGFHSIAEARSFQYRYSRSHSHSIWTAQGRGSDSYVSIKKKPDVFWGQEKLYKCGMEEIMSLSPYLVDSSNEIGGTSVVSSSAKRRTSQEEDVIESCD